MRPVSLSRHRRALIAAVLGAASCAGIGLVQAQEMPKSPVVINVIDAAGNLALTQGAFEAYQAQNPAGLQVHFHQGARPRDPGQDQGDAERGPQ